MEQRSDEIIFTTDEGEKVIFQILEQTRLGGINYLLVSTAENGEEEAEALILKDISKDTDEEAIYDIVEDDKELQAVAAIFEELLDDIELY
jgi:Mn-dependent DtxR family transcriptional regulator